MPRTHDTIVEDQFGPQALAYVQSTVHATGPDLDRVAHVAATLPMGHALDLGCGGGHVSYRIAPHVAHVVASDLSPRMLDAVASEAARRGIANLETRQAAAEALPFADAAFDMVACRMSAHHWSDLDAGLREARRVLKRGGPAVFIDVVSPERAALDTHLQAVELLRDPSHVRDYRVTEWTAALARAGFTIRGLAMHGLPMAFASWIARMRTPEPNVAAIRALQVGASQEVRDAFAIADDGSFTIQVATFELEAS